MEREPGVRFDLDGVAKGWLADRALAITPGRSALVDGDGDVAIRVAPGDTWAIGIGDPREPGTLLGALDLGADGDDTAASGGSRPPAPASTAGRTRAATPTTSSTRARGDPPRRT